MAEFRYNPFRRHEDNVDEIISAEHINIIQRELEVSEVEILRQEDEDFLNKSLFILENNQMVNSMEINLLENSSKLDLINSAGIQLNVSERSISIDNESESLEGTIITNAYVNDSSIKKVILLVNDFKIGGSSITYEITNNDEDWYSIEPNQSNTFEIPTSGNYFKLRIILRRANLEEDAGIKSYAVLYQNNKYKYNLFDDDSDTDIPVIDPLYHSELMGIGPDDHHPKMHSHDGLDGSGQVSHSVLLDIGPDDHHPKNHKHGEDGVDKINLSEDVAGNLSKKYLEYILWTGKEGNLSITRNALAEDKVVKVLSPDEEVYLFYDWTNNGRLNTVITVYDEIATKENMIYGNYTDSMGTTSSILLGTEKEIYNAGDIIIQDFIDKVMDPAI